MHASRPARRLRLALSAAALGVVAALFLLQTPHARAQVTDITLVSNFTQTDGTTSNSI